jgi:hypothetical protein
MLHRDSTIQKCFKVRRFLVPYQPFGRCVIPSRHLSVIVPSVQTTCHTVRTPDRPSIIRSDDLRFRPDPPLCREDSFQVPIKERSSNRPDDVVSRPDARLHKARIAIQIHPSGRQTALVRTRVHQRRKLPIRLQPSGRLPIMVRTRAHQLWKLRVEDQPSERSSPMVRTRKALYGKYLQRTCNRPDDCVFHPDASLKHERFSATFSENPVAQLPIRTAMTTVWTAPAYISAVAHSLPYPINRGLWALTTSRIRH